MTPDHQNINPTLAYMCIALLWILWLIFCMVTAVIANGEYFFIRVIISIPFALACWNFTTMTIDNLKKKN